MLTLRLWGAPGSVAILDRVDMTATKIETAADRSGRYVLADYEWRLLDGVGHFPHREAADIVTGEILRWAKE